MIFVYTIFCRILLLTTSFLFLVHIKLMFRTGWSSIDYLFMSYENLNSFCIVFGQITSGMSITLAAVTCIASASVALAVWPVGWLVGMPWVKPDHWHVQIDCNQCNWFVDNAPASSCE